MGGVEVHTLVGGSFEEPDRPDDCHVVPHIDGERAHEVSKACWCGPQLDNPHRLSGNQVRVHARPN